MIKAIITDIDGVIVGKKHGVNFPLPNDDVIQKLKNLHKTGFPIVLCTAKFQSGIQELVKKTELTNPHITDGGALIIDPLDKVVIKKYTFDKTLVHKILEICIKNNIYMETYTEDDYFMQKDQTCEITEKHTLILQQEPQIVSSLITHAATNDIIKLIAYAKNDEEKNLIDDSLKNIDGLHYIWTMHPTILPIRLCIITINGVSKKHASEEVMHYLNISFDDVLGIGDTLGDWNFMNLCGYVGVVGDESNELKELAQSKGKEKYFFGRSVDDNGFLEILRHFKL